MRRLARVLVVLCVAVPAAGRAADAPPSVTATQIERAARAYDQGNCREVLAAFAAVPNAEQELSLDGLSQYRWGYCLGATGQAGGPEHYKRASEVLTLEAQSKSARLEAYFYGVNALLNLDQRDEARRTAQLAIERYRGGTLTVPADEPQAWFQLGKLFRDSGDPKGALEPFTRAVAEAEKGRRTLRGAYLERIADAAGEQQDGELGRRALALLAKTSPGAESGPQQARLLVAEGKLQDARDLFARAARGAGDAASDAQYAVALLDRTLELDPQLKPVLVDGHGQPLTGLSRDDLRKAAADAARDAYAAMSGRVVEAPRPNGRPGTRPIPAPEDAARMAAAQARWSGALLEALRRGVSLQEWAVQDGYPALFFSPWTNLFVDRVAPDRRDQIVPLR